MSATSSRILAVVLMVGWVYGRPRPRPRPRRRPTWHALGIPAEYASRWRRN